MTLKMKSNQDLPRIVGASWLVGCSVSQLLHQPDPP
jgi:hypothetical protein